MDDLDPRRLRFILAVARTGGVLAAADELGVTPSAVSQQITRLARDTGYTLLTRSMDGSALTPEGLALAEAAQEIERTLANVRARLEQSDTDLKGKIRIGGFQSFLSTIIAPELPDWRQQLPSADIQIVEQAPEVSLRALKAGRLDVAVFELDTGDVGSTVPDGMTETPLLDEPWRLVVPTGSLITDISDLSRLNLPWLSQDATAASSHAASRLRDLLGAEHTVVHHYYSTLTALALIAANEGMAVIPELALRGLTQDGVEVLDVPGLGTRRVVLRSQPRGKREQNTVEVVSSLIRDAVARRGVNAGG